MEGWKPYGIGYTNTDLWKFFETKSKAEDNDELADKTVAALNALRTCLLQFLELGYRNEKRRQKQIFLRFGLMCSGYALCRLANSKAEGEFYSSLSR